MYVRDHARPEFHKALGLDPTDYGFKVFRITSEISKQVFPVMLDIDHPRFKAGLERLLKISRDIDAGARQGGVSGRLKVWRGKAAAALAFARLYTLPVIQNEIPAESKLVPVW